MHLLVHMPLPFPATRLTHHQVHGGSLVCTPCFLCCGRCSTGWRRGLQRPPHAHAPPRLPRTILLHCFGSYCAFQTLTFPPLSKDGAQHHCRSRYPLKQTLKQTLFEARSTGT